ncbi:DPP IV N-terminal domain-containing protein [bacterium]|nr:DPP IV N-terminal domain-containing protein [bacterium]
MDKITAACAALTAFVFVSAALAADGLRIVEPRPGTVCYGQEELSLRAEYSGSLPAEGLRFVWSVSGGTVVSEGINASVRALAYRVQTLTVRALAGDSAVARDSLRLTVIQRPEQFTLSERADWEGEVSSRGTLVAFTSFRSGEPEVWTASTASRGVSRITYQGGWAPSWCVDGRTLVFWSERAGVRDLWLLDLGKDQNNARRLTAGDGYDWLPACSPTDSRVAYCSKRGHRLSLKVLDYAAEGQPPQEVVGPEQHPLFPRWFPDGGSLLFTSYSDSLPVVCKVSLLDGSVSRLAGPGAEDADISPDGSHLVLVRNGSLWLHRLADGYERQLTRDGGAVISPRFFPDGRRVIFASSLSGNYDLWTLDLPLSD